MPPPRRGPNKGRWATPVRTDLTPAPGIPAPPESNSPRSKPGVSTDEPSPAQRQTRSRQRDSTGPSAEGVAPFQPGESDDGEDDDGSDEDDRDADYDSGEEEDSEHDEDVPAKRRRQQALHKGQTKGAASGGSKRTAGGAAAGEAAAAAPVQFAGFFRTHSASPDGSGMQHVNVFVCGPGGPRDGPTLAAIGMDLQRTGNVTFTRTPLFVSRLKFAPPLASNSYDGLVHWLALLGAAKDFGLAQEAPRAPPERAALQPSRALVPRQMTPVAPAPPSPSLPPPRQLHSRAVWSAWREDVGTRRDGTSGRTFFLISAMDGRETAAAHGAEHPVTKEWTYISALSRPSLPAGSPLPGGRQGVLAFLAACMRDSQGMVAQQSPTSLRPFTPTMHSAHASAGTFTGQMRAPGTSPLALAPATAAQGGAPRSPAAVLGDAHSAWALSVPSVTEVGKFKAWKTSLEAYFLTDNAIDDHRAMTILQQLEAHPITLELLEASQIGRVLNSLRRYARPPVAALSARILLSWERTATQVMASCSRGLQVS